MTTHDESADGALIERDAAIAFMKQCAGYFDMRPVDNEDSAHWANITNAETCRRIAKLLAALEAARPEPAAVPASGGVSYPTRSQAKVLAAVASTPKTASEIAHETGRASFAARDRLRELVARGMVLAEGSDEDAGGKKYRLSPVSLSPAPTSGSEAGGESDEQCARCQGNGEIVTDWDRYKLSEPGDKGDEGTAECPDCNGTGWIEAALAAAPSAVGDARSAEACPVCGCEERGQGGYLSCECPAPLAKPASEPADGAVSTAMIDAAMVEMRNIHPPMRRSDCERLLRAALSRPQS